MNFGVDQLEKDMNSGMDGPELEMRMIKESLLEMNDLLALTCQNRQTTI